jgi:hypothetical protein
MSLATPPGVKSSQIAFFSNVANRTLLESESIVPWESRLGRLAF